MNKAFISFALLTSSFSFAGYDEVKEKLNEKLTMYKYLRNHALENSDTALYGHFYLGGVIAGIENSLLIIKEDEEEMEFEEDLYIY
jgi:hypothetical protein